jgi:hypothetical protein
MFDYFKHNLIIPSEAVGKKTHTMIDDELTYVIKDYRNKQTIVKSKSSIHLENTTFNLSLTDNLINFIKELKSGVIGKNVTKKI